MLHQWNHEVCDLLRLTLFVLHNALECHPSCYTYQQTAPFYYWVVFHGVAVTQFTHWRACECVHLWLLQIKLLWSSMHRKETWYTHNTHAHLFCNESLQSWCTDMPGLVRVAQSTRKQQQHACREQRAASPGLGAAQAQFCSAGPAWEWECFSFHGEIQCAQKPTRTGYPLPASIQSQRRLVGHHTFAIWWPCWQINYWSSFSLSAGERGIREIAGKRV